MRARPGRPAPPPPVPAPVLPVALPAPPDAAIARWLRREIAARPPHARSLLATVWGDSLAPHGGEVWLGTLIALLAPFGCNERLVRTSVFRLARDGWLQATAAGRRSRYRLTADGAQRFAQAYRRVYTPPARPWDGRWEMALVPAEASPALRRALRDELAWAGYADLGGGLHARPARGSRDAGDTAAATQNDAAGRTRATPTTFLAQDVADAAGPTLAERAHAAYGLGALAGEYRRFLARFGGVARAIASGAGDPEQGFVVRTLLVHEYRRVRLRDPQLPLALLPQDWPGAAAYALCRDCYRRLQPLAEAHLAATLARSGDRLLPPLPEFYARFPAA